jgi:uncharacterized membrane protein
MDLITLVIVLIIVGVALWLVNSMIPMDPKIKTIINVVVIIAVLLWLLSLFTGYTIGGHVPNPRVGR